MHKRQGIFLIFVVKSHTNLVPPEPFLLAENAEFNRLDLATDQWRTFELRNIGDRRFS